MSKKIDNLIKKMSIRDKARQLTQINADFIKTDMSVKDTGVSGISLTQEDVFACGSVLNFGDARDAEYIRAKYLEKSQNKIPLVMMQDVIHGYRTIFPIPLAIGCSFDLSLAEECAKMSAVEASLNGVDVTFSPMVNLVRDARWGRVMETYGEDGRLNGIFGAATIRGYRAGGLASCVKHYAAYGAAEAGREYNTTDISEHNLREYYLPAFQLCLKENPEVIMTSFNLLNGVPVNADSHLLIDILRGEWGFDGVLVSDYGAVREMIEHGYCPDEKDCAKVSANNTLDLEMMSSTYINNLPQLVEEGAVDISVVDGMVRRVLQLKEKLNLFENPQNRTDAAEADRVCLCPEHREIACRAAQKSFVLLENNGVLPLAQNEEVAFVGSLADEKSILGAWGCAGKPEEAVTVIEGVRKLLGKKVIYAQGCEGGLFPENGEIDKALKQIKRAKTVVACVGEHSYVSGECASRTNISLPEIHLELLRAIKKTGKKLVTVVFAGRPLILNEVKQLSDAILYVWQPGTEGGTAIAKTLFGLSSPEGRLTISFPRSVGQCPVYYNHFSTGRPKTQDTLEGQYYSSKYIDELNAPLYPFGYGLGYTEFVYRGAKLSATQMKSGEKITATVTVKNTGKTDGSEVVQLYIRDKFASFARPVRELKDFRKIYLKAGQEEQVDFEITEDMLKFYGKDAQLILEAGDFDVMIGGDSRCPVTGTFTLIK